MPSIEPKYKLHVQRSNTSNCIYVGVHNSLGLRWEFGEDVTRPSRWERLVGISWEDKVAKAVKRALCRIKDLENEENNQINIINKFNTDLGSSS